MTNTYPPPPQPDGQHYNAAYLGPHGAPHMLDATHQSQLQYSHLNQPMFPKLDSSPTVQDDPNMHMQNLAQELQNHAALGEQQRQQLQQTHPSQPQTPTGTSSGGLGATSHPQSQPGTPDQAPKTNRLRKACDSCSIRKVKVSPDPLLALELRADADFLSATRTIHAKRAPRSTFLVLSKGPADVEGRQIATPKQSNAAVSRMDLPWNHRKAQEHRHRPHLYTLHKPSRNCHPNLKVNVQPNHYICQSRLSIC
jgi:hypothetical protein